eukprot:CAMPEP_0113719004 /NCGR_PEP_ID=MMETSP0038_2-20120614/35543_1 /TAXON_ID=2898 /ORGANISM="Cryptomonas paramecium" /LENGTH=108 /DNA_ID=CAMNT_0000647267 /DNA_START=345 /DNA_END=668 /DNA_ORIENTATION=+ /assembly_acc=CAM_ASM_000170
MDLGVRLLELGEARRSLHHSHRALQLGAPADVWLNIATAYDQLGAGSSIILHCLQNYINDRCGQGHSVRCRGAHIRDVVLESWRISQAQCAMWDLWDTRVTLLRVLVD